MDASNPRWARTGCAPARLHALLGLALASAIAGCGDADLDEQDEDVDDVASA